MRFADGVYRITIGDSSNVREDSINRILALLLASIAFISIMFWYIRRLTNRIIRLSREADAIGAGDLEAPITVKGEDELAMLGSEMDSMRRSVIERMSGERRAWEANSVILTCSRARSTLRRISLGSRPMFSGAKATSSSTMEETIWLSGFWNTMPAVLRI